jgi:quinolinate synthase
VAKINALEEELQKAKAEADILCTSATAVRVVRSRRTRRFSSAPTKILPTTLPGARRQKEIIPIPSHGYCVVHKNLIQKWQVDLLRKEHPAAAKKGSCIFVARREKT